MSEFYTCPGCSQRVDPTDDAIVAAQKVIKTRTFEGESEVLGEGGYFHRSHLLRGWREVPKPSTSTSPPTS